MQQASVKSSKATSFEQHRQTTTNRNFYAAGAVIVIAALMIGFVSMQGSAVYYVTVAEFHAKQAMLTAGDKELRVAGKVIPGTISKNQANVGVSFVAMDKADPSKTIKVSYARIPPDTFKDEAEVVVTGTYKDGVFSANEMLAKCPSKYSSAPEAQ